MTDLEIFCLRDLRKGERFLIQPGSMSIPPLDVQQYRCCANAELNDARPPEASSSGSPKGGSSPSRGMTNLTYVVRYVGDVNTTFESRGASTYYFVCILDIFVPVRVF